MFGETFKGPAQLSNRLPFGFSFSDLILLMGVSLGFRAMRTPRPSALPDLSRSGVNHFALEFGQPTQDPFPFGRTNRVSRYFFWARMYNVAIVKR